MAPTTRRYFLSSCLAFAAAWAVSWRAARAQGLGQFSNAEGPAPCKLDEKATPAVRQDAEFRPGSPARVSLLEPGVTGGKLVVTGVVRGLTCGPIKGAVVDVWQADARGVYDKAGFRLRGHQSTDAAGRYRLETIVPGAVGPQAPHLNVRVTPPGRAVFATRIFFPDIPQNKTDPAFRADLVMKVTESREGKAGTFDLVLNM